MGDMFEELNRLTDKSEIIRAPINYPGGKSKSLKYILPRLPYSDIYVEPFGGSAAVMLSRHKSKIEVFNDRYAGVVAFYRCLRDKSKTHEMIKKLELTLHSREDFFYYKETWENVEDDVERAVRWYQLMVYSFGGMGRNWGRSLSKNAPLADVHKKIKLFPFIHERFKNVQIENRDWYDCLRDYDSPNTVFYLDPPYIDAQTGAFKHILSHDDHMELLNTIFNLDGFVAISGYSNSLYENQEWDNRFEWETRQIIAGSCENKNRNSGQDLRGNVKEVLWIKE